VEGWSGVAADADARAQASKQAAPWKGAQRAKAGRARGGRAAAVEVSKACCSELLFVWFDLIGGVGVGASGA